MPLHPPQLDIPLVGAQAELSSGTMLLDGREGVYAPRGPWRTLTNELETNPVGTAIARPLVAVLRVSDPSRVMRAAREMVFTMLDDNPGLETVSIDPETNERVGLHIDAWPPGHPLAHFSQVYRFDINLSEEPREFLYLPISLAAMTHALGGDAQERKWIGKAFMQRYPDVPVVRVRVEPGHAYLAPIDQLLHDGGSQFSTRPVRHLALEGSLGDALVAVQTLVQDA